jgi:FlaA1/EpsC-like NDP-sugar epimerase
MSWHRLDALLNRLRPHRQPLALLIDVAVVAVCWHVTYLFRLGFERWHTARPPYDHWVLAGLLLLYALVFVASGVPRGVWRFSGFSEVKRLTLACLVAGLIGATVVMMAQLTKVPRAVLALHPVVALMGLTLVRIGYRMLYEHMRTRLSGQAHEVRRALVLGAGGAGRLLVAGIQNSDGWVVIGYLDDAPDKRGGRVAGLPVLGGLDDVERFARLHGITHLIIAMPSVSGPARRRVFDLAGSVGLPVLTVPNVDELLAGRSVDQVRDIEPEDLLGREPVELDEAGISECLSGKVVLITGAGGSIGSELCRQVARYGPARLVLYELSEFALYSIEQELGETFPKIPLVRLVGDVKDLALLRRVFERHRPHIVFHAAAYKHVPLMEDENAWTALRNNTLGTYHVCLASAEQGVQRFVLISTDKAVNPTNVMGASKRAAELVVSHMAAQGHPTQFMAVRFGNVLGSSGSVIPKFKAQIARGGPITLTHPDITRYFMTIPEAARLVVQACAIGETGQICVLDMGEPVRILDLARSMIRLSGRSADEIRVVITGLRPGEKLYEELLIATEPTIPTRIERLRVARLGAPTGEVPLPALLECLAQEATATDDQTRALLRRVVPEFRPAGSGA